jgi:hypothetical protein
MNLALAKAYSAPALREPYKYEQAARSDFRSVLGVENNVEKFACCFRVQKDGFQHFLSS